MSTATKTKPKPKRIRPVIQKPVETAPPVAAEAIDTAATTEDFEPRGKDIAPPPPGPVAVNDYSLDIAQMEKVTSKPIMMTPELASAILAKNGRNRVIRHNRVERYARDMREGRWRLNGEAVIVSDQDNLMNGQHRLQAVVRAGIAVPMWLTEGIAEDTFSTMDAGLTRSAADVLGMRGVTNFTSVAAVTRMVINYRDGVPINFARSPAEIEDAIEHHPEIESYVHSYMPLARLARNSVVSAVCFIAEKFGEKVEEESDKPSVAEFARGVATGADLHPLDARLIFRNRLISMTADRLRRPEQVVIWYYAQRAMNHYLNEREISKLQAGRHEEPYFSEIESAPRQAVKDQW